jgi:hypothetical protein
MIFQVSWSWRLTRVQAVLPAVLPSAVVAILVPDGVPCQQLVCIHQKLQAFPAPLQAHLTISHDIAIVCFSCLAWGMMHGCVIKIPGIGSVDCVPFSEYNNLRLPSVRLSTAGDTSLHRHLR